jgi:hypothetical protein
MVSHRLPALSGIVLLTALAGACSSGTSAPGSTTAPQIPTADLGTLPCDPAMTYPANWAFKTNDGDERCLVAPDPSKGIQFHYGPTNYNDPAEVAKYTLQPGQEVTDCVYVYTPNAQTVAFDAYHVRMRPGSHHMLLYISPPAGAGLSLGPSAPFAPTGTNGPTQCNQSANMRNLFGAQTPQLDITALTSGAPENAGLAVHIPPKQQAVIQAHFINATAKPILREVWANLLFVDESQVTQIGDPIDFIGGPLSINIPMGQSQVIKGTATVPSGVAPDFRLVIGTGHYHTHTTEFKAWATIGGVRQQIIQEYNALDHLPEPGTWNFTSAQQNPVMDTANKAPGAFSGILHMQPGDTIDWECDMTNNDVSPTSPPQFRANSIRFANAVYTGEMCNMFGMYVPSFGQPWSALSY